MRLRLLGTSAGGGVPQWNCRCANCALARGRTKRVKPRTQSSVAVSADGARWFLLNASPDVRLQIEAFPPLRGVGGRRGTAIEGVLLTNGDLDHCLGLAILREDGRLKIHASASVQSALSEGLRLPALLERYGGADWIVPPARLAPLTDRAGKDSGLRYCAFNAPGKPPRYREGDAAPAPDDNVGYLIEDGATGRRMVYLPDMSGLDDSVRAALDNCQLLLVDGTFWSEDEMHGLGTIARPASAMAHWPVGGDAGSLQALAGLPIAQKIYVHVNNTNPMLDTDGPEHAQVLAAGLSVGTDGEELEW